MSHYFSTYELSAHIRAALMCITTNPDDKSDLAPETERVPESVKMRSRRDRSSQGIGVEKRRVGCTLMDNKYYLRGRADRPLLSRHKRWWFGKR